jgi:hypothetical protein
MKRRFFAAAIAALGLCVPAFGQTVTRTVYTPSSCPNGQCAAPQFRSTGTVHIPTPAKAFSVVKPADYIPATSLPVAAAPTYVSQNPPVGTPVQHATFFATPAPSPVVYSQPVYTASYTERGKCRVRFRRA